MAKTREAVQTSANQCHPPTQRAASAGFKATLQSPHACAPLFCLAKQVLRVTGNNADANHSRPYIDGANETELTAGILKATNNSDRNRRLHEENVVGR